MSKNTTGIGSLVVDEHELASSGLDLWRIPKVDASMVHGKNQTYFLTGPIKNEGPFEFIIPSESNEYLMLDKTTIYGEVEVVKANDGDLADADLVTTINNFPQTLFSLIKVYLNGVCINDISTATYGFKAYLENHLSYDVNVKKTTLAATEMYIKDAVGEEILIGSHSRHCQGRWHSRALQRLERQSYWIDALLGLVLHVLLDHQGLDVCRWSTESHAALDSLSRSRNDHLYVHKPFLAHEDANLHPACVRQRRLQRIAGWIEASH